MEHVVLSVAGLLLMFGGLFLALANRSALRPVPVPISKTRGR